MNNNPTGINQYSRGGHIAFISLGAVRSVLQGANRSSNSFKKSGLQHIVTTTRSHPKTYKQIKPYTEFTGSQLGTRYRKR